MTPVARLLEKQRLGNCNYLLFLLYSLSVLGDVAHLARAIEWHSIGSRFDSDHLHSKQLPLIQGVVSFSVLNCNVLLKCFEPNTVSNGHG